jgi:hypothetical protein
MRAATASCKLLPSPESPQARKRSGARLFSGGAVRKEQPAPPASTAPPLAIS